MLMALIDGPGGGYTTLLDATSVSGSYVVYGRGCWGFGIALGAGTSVSTVLGQRLTMCGTRDRVRSALATIDRYARLRLGPEYLEAYAAAYA